MITKSLLDYYGVVHLFIFVLVFIFQRPFNYFYILMNTKLPKYMKVKNVKNRKIRIGGK